MAAKTIQEAVEIGTKGLLADQETLVKELRDFFAHKVQVLEYRHSLGLNNGSARLLFDEIFSGIPAYKESRNE